MPRVIRFVPGVLIFIFWLYCVIDVITSREDGIRNLGKNIWLLIVFFFPLIGSIAWIAAGRPVAERPLTREQGAAPSFPEYERRGRFSAADPEKDEEFLRQVRERAEEQRRRHEEKKRAEREPQESQQPQSDEDSDPDPVT
ncbi:PLDc_N domain-containing protein [Nocardioides immobilis]|uniref:PLDc_N domain-containing protein n=1 Tax=Nocardioides immobilis TaxID=2049295 RepID=A0A417Y3I5_9ACTN|nr:PLDc_N domain-containing protein [Nocardioides immobilis]